MSKEEKTIRDVESFLKGDYITEHGGLCRFPDLDCDFRRGEFCNYLNCSFKGSNKNAVFMFGDKVTSSDSSHKKFNSGVVVGRYRWHGKNVVKIDGEGHDIFLSKELRSLN